MAGPANRYLVPGKRILRRKNITRSRIVELVEACIGEAADRHRLADDGVGWLCRRECLHHRSGSGLVDARRLTTVGGVEYTAARNNCPPAHGHSSGALKSPLPRRPGMYLSRASPKSLMAGITDGRTGRQIVAARGVGEHDMSLVLETVAAIRNSNVVRSTMRANDSSATSYR